MDALGVIAVEKAVDRLAQHDVRLHLGDLGTDVEMQSAQVDVWQGQGVSDDLVQGLDADAEFVVGSAGGDVLVGVGVDVGVDPEGDARLLAHLAGQLVDDFEFRDGFHIKAPDTVLDT